MGTFDPEYDCPHCGIRLDGHIQLKDGQAIDDALPDVGDISMCFTCGGFITWTAAHHIVELPKDQAPAELRAIHQAWRNGPSGKRWRANC